LKILLIADPHISIPPSHYGGTERIVHLYAKEASRLGNTVNLLAAKGSDSYGGSVVIHKSPSTSRLNRAYRKLKFQFQSLLESQKCDVVYNHGRFDYLEILLALDFPILHCFHNIVEQKEINFAEARMKSNAIFHFISSNQSKELKLSKSHVCIPNCIDTSIYHTVQQPSNYLLYLGRITRNKGVDIAITAAKQARLPLIIAGNIGDDPESYQYFKSMVMPHLDENSIKWVGPVDDHQKATLLANALALLFPIRWQEPFGLVMIEALASGCPIIASNCASAPEIIENGITGFLCDSADISADSLVDAIQNIHKIDRRYCRVSAESRFDATRIVPKTLDVLYSLSMAKR